MDIQKRIESFVKFGESLKYVLKHNDEAERLSPDQKEIITRINDCIKNLDVSNPWFTMRNVKLAIDSISGNLTAGNISIWTEKYIGKLRDVKKPLTIGVVMAGNIPLVGFFDFFCVLMSGNKILGKLSSDDNKLLPLLSELLINIEPEFEKSIEFKNEKLSGFDAIIATGSDNTARYFNYYFGKYPHIIRKNRNGIAVLTGSETIEELTLLGEDIFSYFGLGCRNVSKLYVPPSFSFNDFFDAISEYSYVVENYKYKNNYDYYKSIFLINKEKFYDNGFVTLRENPDISSAVSTLNFEYYENVDNLTKHLKAYSDRIQCIVADKFIIPESVPFGSSQLPQLWDYADNIDTMEFLLGLS